MTSNYPAIVPAANNAAPYRPQQRVVSGPHHAQQSTNTSERARTARTQPLKALESSKTERLGTHPDDVHVEQTRTILRRTYAVLVPQQRGTQVAPQFLVANLLDAKVAH